MLPGKMPMLRLSLNVGPYKQSPALGIRVWAS